MGAIEYVVPGKPPNGAIKVIEVKPEPKPEEKPPPATGSAGGAIQTTAPPADADDPESQAKRRLSAAKIYIATDPARAKDLLRKVITDFPGTEASKEARKELGRLN
ncbi:MAG: hypothetical protein HZA50_10730 [Planctomycetes bacterium]|nr:hypothetical protein [Planctomycetota bacterium]